MVLLQLQSWHCETMRRSVAFLQAAFGRGSPILEAEGIPVAVIKKDKYPLILRYAVYLYCHWSIVWNCKTVSVFFWPSLTPGNPGELSRLWCWYSRNGDQHWGDRISWMITEWSVFFLGFLNDPWVIYLFFYSQKGGGTWPLPKMRGRVCHVEGFYPCFTKGCCGPCGAGAWAVCLQWWGQAGATALWLSTPRGVELERVGGWAW